MHFLAVKIFYEKHCISDPRAHSLFKYNSTQNKPTKHVAIMQINDKQNNTQTQTLTFNYDLATGFMLSKVIYSTTSVDAGIFHSSRRHFQGADTMEVLDTVMIVGLKLLSVLVPSHLWW